MLNPKLLHNLAWIPAFLIGLCGVILGLLWLILDEPWLLDRADYSFFGLSVFALGMMICAYVLITFMGTRRARNTLFVILGILLAALFYLEYAFIPTSPFVILTCGLLILYLVSLWASFLLNREEKQTGRN